MKRIALILVSVLIASCAPPGSSHILMLQPAQLCVSADGKRIIAMDRNGFVFVFDESTHLWVRL